jgi:glycosyltransferase involved in cell wall biosynthesis
MNANALHILQLSPQVPYPLSDGGKVGIFNITRHLAQLGHRVTMLALDRTPEVDGRPLEEYCELIRVPHTNKNSIPSALLNLFSDEPYTMAKYESRLYRDTLAQLLSRRDFDVVHADHLHMARYGLLCKQLRGLPVVLREHNIESVILERFAENARPALLRPWARVQAKRIRTYEGRLAAQCDVCCAITEEDRRRLAVLAPLARISVIPAGVSEELFLAGKREPRPVIPRSIAMFGSFDWLPNQDALRWFLLEIFPEILRLQPDARVYVIGKGVPDDIRSMQNKSVVVRGYVEDLAAELVHYAITVVPLRIGGGMRLKIVESFALNIPVVSTTIGCEGISCIDGEHVLVADDEPAFARQVVRLLVDEELRRRLAGNALALAHTMYRWSAAAKEFEKVYQSVKEASRNAAPRGGA